MSQFTAQVDAREYPSKDKHAVIMKTFQDLCGGSTFNRI